MNQQQQRLAAAGLLCFHKGKNSMMSLEEVEKLKGIAFALAMLAQARRIQGDAVYTVDEAARLVQCHRNTLLNAILARKLTAAKIGKNWRIRGEHLNAWLDSGGKTGRTKGRY